MKNLICPNPQVPLICHRVFETHQIILVPEYLNWKRKMEEGKDEEDENLYMN